MGVMRLEVPTSYNGVTNSKLVRLKELKQKHVEGVRTGSGTTTGAAEGKRVLNQEAEKKNTTAEGTAAPGSDDPVHVPMSYTSNSNKEELCLEYVAAFEKQLKELFPQRPPVFIYPKNEWNVPKFVCTSLRPTLLPYKEFYNATDCARFISTFIEYEPLENPTQFPTIFPSATCLLDWLKGDCFDLANLLASCLIGSGYDAYVVSGTAPKWICLQDQSKTECPLIDELKSNSDSRTSLASSSKNEEGEVPETSVSHYPRERAESQSTLFQMQEDKDEDRMKRLYEVEDIDFEEDVEEDPFANQRIHAWVLIRGGKREIQNHLFVEPSTGRFYATSDSPYQKIESIWNNQNYFVNMQVQDSLEFTTFDLSNSNEWEYVFIDNRGLGNDHVEDEVLPDDSERDASNFKSTEEENILDIPKSWVEKIVINHDIYRMKYSNCGENTTIYRKAKLEQFAEGVNNQGIVIRITKFRDMDRTIPIECREYFSNRKDKLDYRIRYLLEGKVHEHFLPGRLPEALKDRIEWIGERRELHFYTGARLDGLVYKQELINKKVIENFDPKDREDGLFRRTVTLSKEKNVGGSSKVSYIISSGTHQQLSIVKMTEKFEKDMCAIGEEKTPRKRTYYVRDGTVRVQYHYAPGKITASYRIYHRANPEKTEIFEVDSQARCPKDSVVEEEFHRTMQLEKDCYSAIRNSDSETQEILKTRKLEEREIIIEPSIFEKARESAGVEKDSEQNQTNEKGVDAQQTDYLTPYIQHVVNMDAITREEAQKVRDLCLKALKDRLLERANIIQSRLDEENAQLAKRQAAFQRSQHGTDHGTDEQYETQCSQAMFRISILEQRLTRHEETALQKYADLDQKLQSDKRLQSGFR